MNLFISWSGQRSELVAKALHPWIKCVLQNIDPFFSPSDISGGSIWINKLNDKLASSNAGVICLTPENQHMPWIQFEAGALAKGLTENRVFVLLIGLESNQVSGPLSSFNHTAASKEGIEKMIYNLNELLGEKSLPTDILNRIFQLNYPDLEKTISQAESLKITEKKPEKRDIADVQNEMLDLLRGLSKRVSNIENSYNYKTATETWTQLKTKPMDSFEGYSKIPSFGDFIKEYPLKIGKKKNDNDDELPLIPA